MRQGQMNVLGWRDREWIDHTADLRYETIDTRLRRGDTRLRRRCGKASVRCGKLSRWSWGWLNCGG